MKVLLCSNVWWPGIDRDLEETIHGCPLFQENQKASPSTPTHPFHAPSAPWKRVPIDYARPMLNNMFLIIVDAYSKWIDVHAVDSATTKATVDKLRCNFAEQGVPEMSVSNDAICFISEEFKKFTA